MDNQDLETKWIECSLTLPAELADRVSEALSGIFPGGVAQEREFDAVFPDQLDQVTEPIRVFGFVPVQDLDDVQIRIAEALNRLPDDLPRPEYVPLVEKNWAAAWQDRYQPIPIGSRLIIVPSWLENPEPGRQAVYIDPGMAFGSGTHPTTQLTLILLERALDGKPEPLLIDIGCGSGILSIAAAKLGLDQVLGVDNDPDVIRVSRENSLQNETQAICEFEHGSVRELLEGRIQPSCSGLVAANIIAPILTQLFSDGLGQVVSPGGTLILSGILEEQLAGILGLLGKAGFVLVDQLEQDGWCALQAVKPAAADQDPQV